MALKRNAATLLLACALAPLDTAADEGFVRRASVSSRGAEAAGYATGYHGHMSADGRFVTFVSSASNLVSRDTNGLVDVFVHDTWTGRTERVSVSSRGAQATHSCIRLYAGSLDPTLSADGRYVAFASSADNLVANDTNCQPDVFLFDRTTRRVSRVSIGNGSEEANEWSGVPSLSADGKVIAFWTGASNLVADDTTGFQNVLVRDLAARETRLVSRSPTGAAGNGHSGAPAVSPDGRYVAFGSMASNLAPDDDINGLPDIFLHDRQTGQVRLISSEANGFSGNAASFDLSYWYNFRPAVSEGGLFVAFTSNATDLVGWDFNARADVFIRDTQRGVTEWADLDSWGQLGYGGHSYRPALSPDGRFVGFVSEARNFVPLDMGHNNQTHIYLRDRQLGQTSVHSLSNDAVLGDQLSTSPALSADGRVIAFQSDATNLVSLDTNRSADLFVRDRQLDTARRADLAVVQASDVVTVARGETATYTLRVDNNGSAMAVGVSLIDVPSSLGVVTKIEPTQGICRGRAVIVCRLGNLRVGRSATITLSLRSRSTGAMGNHASVVSLELDATPGNNTSDVSVTVKR